MTQRALSAPFDENIMQGMISAAVIDDGLRFFVWSIPDLEITFTPLHVLVDTIRTGVLR